MTVPFWLFASVVGVLLGVIAAQWMLRKKPEDELDSEDQ